ncbi:MAG: hypothetical protein ABW061_19090 [Polyangiaceae bacterium]
MTFLSKHVRISALLLLCVACSTDENTNSAALTRQALEPCGSIADCSPYACEFSNSCYSLCHYDSQCAANAVCNNLCARDTWSCGDQEDDLTCIPILYNDGLCNGAYAKNPLDNNCFTGCDHDEQCNPGYVCNGSCVAAGGAGGGGGAGAGGSGASGAGGGGAAGASCGTAGSAASAGIAGSGGALNYANTAFYPGNGCQGLDGVLDRGSSGSLPSVNNYSGCPIRVLCPFVHDESVVSFTATASVSAGTTCTMYSASIGAGPSGTLNTSTKVDGAAVTGGLRFSSLAANYFEFAICTVPNGGSVTGFSITEVH